MRNDYKAEVTLYIVDDEKEARDSMVGLFGTDGLNRFAVVSEPTCVVSARVVGVDVVY
jgi:FixJ family two-component response regulator